MLTYTVRRTIVVLRKYNRSEVTVNVGSIKAARSLYFWPVCAWM